MMWLQLQSFRAGYGKAWVVRGVDLEVGGGTGLAVLGRNGMGKTTLLKGVMGFLRRVEGRVVVLGQEIRGWAPFRVARLGVAYVPQERALFQDLTVEENLRLVAQQHGVAFGEVMGILGRWFPVLAERRRQLAGTLSGGEQRMLLVARALAMRPKILLMDEVSEGLQPLMVERLREVILQAKREAGLCALLVEQNVGFAISVAERYAVMELGRIVECGEVTGEATREKLERRLGTV